jgi:CHAT domain-containing protein
MRRFPARSLLSLVFFFGGFAVALGPVEEHRGNLNRSHPSVAASPTPSSPPRERPMVLAAGSRRPHRLEKGFIDVYSFRLKTGEFLRLEFEQRGVDLAVEVRDPMGNAILHVDSPSGAEGSEDVPFIAQAPGLHQVRVSGEPGTYVPRLVARRVPMPQDVDLAGAARAYSRGAYSEAVRLSDHARASRWKADSLSKLADRECQNKSWKSCLELYRRSLSLYEKEGNISRQAVVLTKLAEPEEILGDQGLAFRDLQESVNLSRRIKAKRTEAIARLNLANLLMRRGEIESALQNYKLSFVLFGEARMWTDQARALNGQGGVYTYIGRIDQALALHRKALEKLKSVNNDSLRAETLTHIGAAYAAVNKYAFARSYYSLALDRARSLGDKYAQAIALNDIGSTYYRELRYRDSLDAYSQAIALFKAEAREADEAAAWSNIGWLKIDLDDVPSALEAFGKAISISRRLGRLPTEMAATFGVAWAERHRNSPVAAQRYVQRAIDILEELRRKAVRPELQRYLLGSRQGLYEFLVDVLMDQHQRQPAAGYDIAAFAASEGARARSLLDSLGERSAPPLLSMRDVQRQVLDDHTILLEYHLGEEKSFLWAVTPDSHATFELPGRAKIEALAREVYDLLQTSGKTEVLPKAAEESRKLAEILLGPVAKNLSDKRLLIVVPPSLQYIPFGVLPDVNERRPEGDSPEWPVSLKDHHEIVSSPSASVIEALRQAQPERKPPSKHMAIFSAPFYTPDDERLGKLRSPFGPVRGDDLLGGRFKPLKYSETEADKIIRLAGRSNVLDLRGFDASRERVLDRQLEDFKYIYFSVHGDPDARNPERSSLVLSAFDRQGKSTTPWVYARDIQEMHLSADLVVLGACGSGLGEEVAGEGLVGLTQAFLTAGAPRVLVGLWNLDDEATSEMIPMFYSYLLKEGKSPAAALRFAQIEMSHKRGRNAPAYWGGLVLQGEWR